MIVDIVLLAGVLYIGYGMYNLTEEFKRHCEDDNSRKGSEFKPDIADTTQEK